jgi:hypothetical protein
VGARQARLRREYAGWYPSLSVANWITASTVARAVTRQLLDVDLDAARGPRWEPGSRILDARHFEFRGGTDPLRSASQRTRRADGPSSLAAQDLDGADQLGSNA